jgi:hypothetical protein
MSDSDSRQWRKLSIRWHVRTRLPSLPLTTTPCTLTISMATSTTPTSLPLPPSPSSTPLAHPTPPTTPQKPVRLPCSSSSPSRVPLPSSPRSAKRLSGLPIHGSANRGSAIGLSAQRQGEDEEALTKGEAPIGLRADDDAKESRDGLDEYVPCSLYIRIKMTLVCLEEADRLCLYLQESSLPTADQGPLASRAAALGDSLQGLW